MRFGNNATDEIIGSRDGEILYEAAKKYHTGAYAIPVTGNPINTQNTQISPIIISALIIGVVILLAGKK